MPLPPAPGWSIPLPTQPARRLALASVFAVGSIAVVSAQTSIDWNNTGTAYTTGANWAGGSFPADDLTSHVASFNTASPTFQPTLSTDRSVAGLAFGSSAGAFTFSGTGTLTLGTAGIANSTSTATQTISVPLALGAISTFSNAGTSLLLSNTLNLGGFALTLTGAGANATLSGQVSGTGSITKSGSGRWTLSAANSYTGGTTVNGGQLTLAVSDTLAAGSNVVVNSTTAGATATLTLNAGISQSIGTLTFGGTGATATSTSNVTLGAGATLTLGGTLTYDATNHPLGATVSGGTLALGGHRTIVVGDSSSATLDLTIGSVISGGGHALTKTGAGRLFLSGANTYDGGTIIHEGNVSLFSTGTLPAGGNLTLNAQSGAAFAQLLLNTTPQTIGSLVFGGPGAATNASNSIVIPSGGSLTLGGTVTYDATNNPGAGSFQGSSATVALGGNRIFAIANSSSTTSEFNISSALTGSGQSLTKTGAGRITFSAGSSTYDGGTFLHGGEIFLNASNTLASTGNIDVNGQTAGTTTSFILGTGFSQTIGALTFGGAGATSTSTNTLTLNSGSTLTLGGTVTFDATSHPLGATISGSGTLALGASRNFNIGDSSGATTDLAISSVIAGTGHSLTKTGTGTLALSAANTYSGGTVIDAGILATTGDSRLPSAGNIAVNATTAGATAELSLGGSESIGTLTFGGTSATATSTSNVTVASGRTLTLGGTVTYDATNNPRGATISGGTVALGGHRTFDVGDSSSATSDLTIASVLSGSGHSLIKTGTGTLRLSSANTFDGGTVVHRGVLSLNASHTLAASGSVTINGQTAGTTTNLSLGSGFSQSIGTLTFGGAGATSTSINTLSLHSGSTLTLGGTVTYDATNNPGNAAINGIGTLALGGSRIFDIGDSTNSGGELIISTAISGSGFGLTKIGAGTLVLSGTNTYSGVTTVNRGRISVLSNTALSGDVVINGTAAGSTTALVIGSGTSATIGSLTYGGPGATSTSTNSVSGGGGTLTLGGTVTFDATNNPFTAGLSTTSVVLGGDRIFNIGNSTSSSIDFSVSSALSGTGHRLTKTGAGTLALTGANTYTGGTTISAGTLLVNNASGSGVGTGAVVVQSGSFLGGSGTLGALTTVQSGGTLTPSILTFTQGLTLDDGAIFNFELGTTSDKLVISGGTLTGSASAGALTLNLSNSGGFAAGTYTLFDFSSGGTVTSSFNVSDFTFGTTIAGFTYGLALNGNTLQLTASAIPEPSTYALLGSLAALALAGWRRHRKSAA